MPVSVDSIGDMSSIERERCEVIVIGAGLAGLGAAHRLRRSGHSVVVLEREAVPGGRARSDAWGDARVELGAWFLTPNYHRVMRLVEELGLGAEVLAPDPGFPFAVRDGEGWRYTNLMRAGSLARAFRLRDVGPLLAAPARLARPLLRSRGRLHDIDIDDVTASAAFDDVDVSRLFGPFGEVLGVVAETYVGYAPGDLSGSFVATLAGGIARGGLATPSRMQPSVLARGTGSLTQAIAAELDVRAGVTVDRVTRSQGRVLVTATDEAGRQLAYEADSVVLATTADVTARIWSDAPTGLLEFLASVRYSQVALLYLRLREPYIHRSPEGERCVEAIPVSQRHGRLPMGAAHMDWAVPSGGLLVTGESAPDRRTGLEYRGEEMADRLERSMYALHPELRSQVVDRRLVEADYYVPVFEPGYTRRLDAARRGLRPGAIDIAGDYLNCPILEGALASGEAAADRVSSFLSHNRVRSS